MTRGGVRKGAGRPKQEPTKVMRVPVRLIGEIQDYISFEGFKLPFYAGRVSAGQALPNDDHVADRIDLTQYLVKRPEDTFLVQAAGESMIDAGIKDGDMLIVDRSITPTNGKIVIAAVDGALTVKFLIVKQGKAFLMPANAEFPPIPVDPENGVWIWGVVTSSIHNHLH